MREVRRHAGGTGPGVLMRSIRLASFSLSVFVAVLATHGVSTAQPQTPQIGRVPPPPAMLSAATRTDLTAIPEPSAGRGGSASR